MLQKQRRVPAAEGQECRRCDRTGLKILQKDRCVGAAEEEVCRCFRRTGV